MRQNERQESWEQVLFLLTWENLSIFEKKRVFCECCQRLRNTTNSQLCFCSCQTIEYTKLSREAKRCKMLYLTTFVLINISNYDLRGRYRDIFTILRHFHT